MYHNEAVIHIIYSIDVRTTEQNASDCTDMDTLIRFTVCQTCLTQLTWLFLIKCNLRLTVCIHCSPQSEANFNIYAVGA